VRLPAKISLFSLLAALRGAAGAFLYSAQRACQQRAASDGFGDVDGESAAESAQQREWRRLRASCAAAAMPAAVIFAAGDARLAARAEAARRAAGCRRAVLLAPPAAFRLPLRFISFAAVCLCAVCAAIRRGAPVRRFAVADCDNSRCLLVFYRFGISSFSSRSSYFSFVNI